MKGEHIAEYLFSDDPHNLLYKTLIKYFDDKITSNDLIRYIDQLGHDTIEILNEKKKDHGKCPGCKYC